MALSRYTATIVFQFTPLREGRRKHRPQHPDERDISIHAPPRGATMPSPSVTASTNFNSRPSARGDPHGTNLPNSFFISIHAPPRGATREIGGIAGNGKDFNSRPSARGDARRQHSRQPLSTFQFTPLREGRHLTLEEAYKAAIFQFTPLREGRQSLVSADTRFPIFQFTPLREGRLIAQCSHSTEICISIHAPPRGATDVAAALSD